MMLRILITIFVIAIVHATVNDNDIIDDVDPNTLYGQDLVDYINDLHTTWKAVPNGKFDRVSNAVKYGMLGVNNIRQLYERNEGLTLTGDRDDEDDENDLPESFDSRMQWPQCRSLNNIRDQSSCGSCWAFGAVEAMSDRICIASAGKIQVTLSADDLLSCCSSCGFGCNGGDPMAAWRYWVSDGIVTGSNYTEKHGCRPYPFPPCEHHSNKTHFPSCQHDLFPTPRCDRQCQPAYTKKSYADDKHYGSSAYAVASNAAAIQKEIMTHGPVEAAFEVYEDFLVYGGGVYQHKAGKFGGGHAVKMIGWGVDNGVDYWLVANSWNTDWGENGMFRILRGSDECGIESGIVAGIPKINLTKKHHQHSNVHRHLKNVMSFA